MAKDTSYKPARSVSLTIHRQHLTKHMKSRLQKDQISYGTQTDFFFYATGIITSTIHTVDTLCQKLHICKKQI